MLKEMKFETKCACIIRTFQLNGQQIFFFKNQIKKLFIVQVRSEK